MTEPLLRAVTPMPFTRDWCRSGNRVRTRPVLLAREARDYDGCQAGRAIDRDTQGRRYPLPQIRRTDHDATYQLLSAIAGIHQETRRARRVVSKDDDRSAGPRARRDSRIATERLRVLRRHARQGGPDPRRARTAHASRRDLARVDAVLTARARRARMDRGADASSVGWR